MWENVGKCGRAGETTDGNMACRITKATDTHSEYGRAGETTDDNMACRITKATDTHSEYVTLTAFPL
jgi:hypothetical protein